VKFGERETVEKPWGREKWLELNDKYCLKRIEINAGHVTSLQYHEYKSETIALIEGEALLYYGGVTSAVCQKKPLKPGDCFTVLPGEIHRMEAVTDIVFLEASTPEVWDVVRLEDGYGRK
jgi:mannose-6-phosphate isomerase-like protein (cupin superfamily)